MNGIVFKAIVAFVAVSIWGVGMYDVMLNDLKIFKKIWKWLGGL